VEQRSSQLDVLELKAQKDRPFYRVWIHSRIVKLHTIQKCTLLLLVVMVFSLSLKLYYSQKYATHTDELLSAFVAESISKSGFPVLPSGGIYFRAPLHHYILSIPIGIFGTNYFSMRITSILFSLLTIWTIYLLGTRVRSRSVGLAAVLLLSLNPIFNQFALSGRMYMTFAFFYTLTLYLFYRGFVEGQSVAKKLTVPSLAACMLSSEAGILLGPVFAFLLCVYHRADWFRDRTALAGMGIWMILTYLILFYHLPGSYDPFTVHSGVEGSMLFNYHFPVRTLIVKLSGLWRRLDESLPLSVPFFIVMTMLILARRRLKNYFPLLCLIPALLIATIMSGKIQSRIILAFLPLYCLCICHFLSVLWKWCKEGLKAQRSAYKFLALNTNQILVSILAFFLLSAGILRIRHYYGQAELLSYLSNSIGYHDFWAGKDARSAYMYVKQHAEPQEIVIQTTLEYGFFFLGQNYEYYYLRQKKSLNGAGEFSYNSFQKERDPFYNIHIIDSLENLRSLIVENKGTIWVILDAKSEYSIGAEIKDFISTNFTLAYDNFRENKMRVYVIPQQLTARWVT
jgi:4-amino-4-deoxy-L-arabinose transferase-like glycosyltransferase